MRILHVSPTAFGAEGIFGGGERYPVELARAVGRIDGVEAELVTFGTHARVEEVDGLRVNILRPLARWRGHPAQPLNPAVARAVQGADIVHAHHLASAPAVMAAVAARARGRHAVVTDHGLARPARLRPLGRLFERFLTVSRYSADVIGAPLARTRVIYGGADTRRFAPGGETRTGVLFVGRLTPHKGVDHLLRALPPGARLTIAGTPGHDPRPPECGYVPLLQRLAAGRDVHVAEAVGDAALALLYRRAAVLAVPSVRETCYGRRVEVSELLSLSTIEAMASGTPVVASRIGGLAEVVVDGETGVLVEPGDTEALRAALAALLADPARARRLGDNARSCVLERFTWDICARRCLEAYDEILR